jgi:hypothetical protein
MASVYDHVERKNDYREGAHSRIVDLRTPFNDVLVTCEKTYFEELTNRLQKGDLVVSKRVSRVLDQCIISVDSSYFEGADGYDKAVSFFRDAFLFFADYVGKRNILSAVMHADEINPDHSFIYAKEVFHYHLHIVFIPVGEKLIFTTGHDGKISARAERRISHFALWPKTSRAGNSYSVFHQDIANHMTQLGYPDLQYDPGSLAPKAMIAYKDVEENVQSSIIHLLEERDELEKRNKALEQQLEHIPSTEALSRIHLHVIEGIDGKQPRISPNEWKKIRNLLRAERMNNNQLHILRAENQNLRCRVDSYSEKASIMNDERMLAAYKIDPGKYKALTKMILDDPNAKDHRTEVSVFRHTLRSETPT